MLKSVLHNILFILFLVYMPFSLFGQGILDGIAAIVGGKIILKSEVIQLAQMSALQRGVDLVSDPQSFAVYQEDALNALVAQKILVARAQVDSLDDIPSDEVDQAVDNQVQTIIAQVGSEDRFKELTNQSIREFKSERWYDIRDQLVADRYRAQKMSMITVSRDEVIEFFNTYKDSIPPMESSFELAQIIIPVLPGDKSHAEALARITRVKEELADGKDFAQLALEYSDDTASKIRGGALGFVRRGELVPEFEETAFRLQEGEISNIVKTVFGYHIIQLIEKQGERINARHILINVQPTELDRDNSLKQVREHYFLLEKNPALFDSLADISSKAVNQQQKQEVGYIGWLTLSQLPSDVFRSALFGAKAGTITPPFEMPAGFHILRVLSFREGGNPTLEAFYPQIAAMALQHKQSQYFNDWLDGIRNEVFVKTFE